MSIREKFFKAMRREAEGYVPFEFNLSPALVDEFKRGTGAENYQEYFQFPIRGVGPRYIGRTDKFNSYFPPDANLHIDPEWGIGHEQGTFAHFERMIPPMQPFRH